MRGLQVHPPILFQYSCSANGSNYFQTLPKLCREPCRTNRRDVSARHCKEGGESALLNHFDLELGGVSRVVREVNERGLTGCQAKRGIDAALPHVDCAAASKNEWQGLRPTSAFPKASSARLIMLYRSTDRLCQRWFGLSEQIGAFR